MGISPREAGLTPFDTIQEDLEMMSLENEYGQKSTDEPKKQRGQ